MIFKTELNQHMKDKFIKLTSNKQNEMAAKLAKDFVDAVYDKLGRGVYVQVHIELDGFIEWSVSPDGHLPQYKDIARKISHHNF